MKKILNSIAIASLLCANLPAQAATGYFVSSKVTATGTLPVNTYTAYKSDTFVCGKTVSSCSMTRSAAKNICTTYKNLSTDTTTAGFVSGGSLTIPGFFSIGATGGLTWTKKTTDGTESEACSTTTVSQTCVIKGGQSTNVEAKYQFQTSKHVVETIYSTAGGNIKVYTSAKTIMPLGEVLSCNVWTT